MDYFNSIIITIIIVILHLKSVIHIGSQVHGNFPSLLVKKIISHFRYFIMMGNGLGKCSSISGVLIFIFKDIPELCMLADVLVMLLLAFYTFLCFQNSNILIFLITKLMYAHF